ncbi:MAG: hypothetical protein OXU77_19300 [Gammaproteobacteria bacterium]|nr:hypothetical protein [Gammaproteobacteria bacterium]
MGIRQPFRWNRIRRPGSGTARTVMLFALLSMAGCISIEKFEEPPPILREAIRNGDLVTPGQHVSVVTTSRGELEFRVTHVDRKVIRGEEVEVPIKEVVALQTRRIDFLASASLAAGWYVLMVAVAYLALALR